MGYAAWHSSFIPPGSQVRSPLTVPGQYKGLRPCGGMYPLTRVGFLETSSPVRRGEGGGVGKGGPLWSPASCSLCSPIGEHDHTPIPGDHKGPLHPSPPLSPLRIIRPPAVFPSLARCLLLGLYVRPSSLLALPRFSSS